MTEGVSESGDLKPLFAQHSETFPPTRKMAAPLMEKLAESLGSPEPAVRLILSILIGKFLHVRPHFCVQPPNGHLFWLAVDLLSPLRGFVTANTTVQSGTMASHWKLLRCYFVNRDVRNK